MPDTLPRSVWTHFFPPKCVFTERNVGDLSGKVYIVTGSTGGVGRELARLLFSKNAKVYIAARSANKAKTTIEDIKKAVVDSTGQLVFLYLDFNDLTTIKSSAAEFLSKEKKLHVLFNNAGVMRPPQGSKTVQGYELQLGVNNIAPFLFTKLLIPTLASTAKLEAPNTVRVVWTSTVDIDAGGPKGGVEIDNLDYHVPKSPVVKYVTSKVGNYLHAVELAGRYRDAGIISIALNPGNLRTELARHMGSAFRFLVSFICYPPVNGAYTELFAGLSPDVTMERSGHWIAPFGRFMAIRPDLLEATKLETEGGTGIGAKFWEWTEEQVKPYI